MVRIEINNVSAKLKGDKSILNSLYESLAFKHPDAFHIRKHISRAWDGMVYPLSKSGVIHIGLLQKVENLLSELTDTVEVVDYRKIPESLPIKSTIGEKIKFRPYQIQALSSVINNQVFGSQHPRGVVAAAVGAGKTIIVMGAFETYAKVKSLVLLNNTPLYNQWVKDLKEVFPGEAGYIKGKDFKDGSIIVAMVQSARNRVDTLSSLFKSFRAVYVDEADNMVNDSTRLVLKACPNAVIRVGFTGTAFVRDLKKDKVRNIELEKMFGPALYSINSEELAEKGFSTKTLIKILPGPSIRLPAGNYASEVTGLTSSEKTLQAIYLRVLYNMGQGRNHIMIYNRFIPVAEKLYGYLRKRLPPHITLGLLDHKRYKDNPQILEDFKNGKINILVNTLFLQRGLNLPLVKVIINNSGGDYPATPLQILGRGVRLHENKDLFIFEDIFHIGGYMTNHNKSRLKAYKDFEYQIEDLRE
jgi:superfamily II DNA or RNA helicase